MQTLHHISTCWKNVECRFNIPWTPSDKTRTEEKIDGTILRQSKKLIDAVLSYIITKSGLSDVILSEILEEFGVIAEQYDNALMHPN